MAYVNVSLPVGEGKLFKIPPYNREESFTELTIDEDKNMILFTDGRVDRDNPEDESFYFFYKGKIISLILDGQEYRDSKTKIWKLRGISIPPEIDKDDVLNELRKALRVYGCHGMCESEQELWRKKFNDPNPNGFALIDF